MCYYLNVQFQGQRFNTNSVSSSSSSLSSSSLSYNRYAAPSKALINASSFILKPLTSPSSRTFYLSFNNMFQKAVPTQNVTNLVSLPSFYCTQNVPFFLDTSYYSLTFYTIGQTGRFESHGEQIASNCKAISSSRSRNNVSCQDVTKAKTPRSGCRVHYVKKISHRFAHNLLKPKHYFMHYEYSKIKLHILSTQCVHVFCMYLRTNSHFHTIH